jgi:monoamine oxidase
MCRAVPLDAPWNAKKAIKWDQTTVAQWLGRNVRSRAAHDLLETAIAATYTSAGSEASLPNPSEAFPCHP